MEEFILHLLQVNEQYLTFNILKGNALTYEQVRLMALHYHKKGSDASLQ